LIPKENLKELNNFYRIEEKKGFGKNLRSAKKIEIIEDRDILKIDNEGFLRFMDRFLSPL